MQELGYHRELTAPQTGSVQKCEAYSTSISSFPHLVGSFHLNCPLDFGFNFAYSVYSRFSASPVLMC